MAEKNNQNNNPKKIKFNPWIIYIAAIAIFIGINIVSGGSNWSEPIRTSTSEFSKLLEEGDIEKIVVYNQKEAEIFIKEEAV